MGDNKEKAKKMAKAHMPKTIKPQDLKFEVSDSLGAITNLPNDRGATIDDHKLWERLVLYCTSGLAYICIRPRFRLTKVDEE